MLRSSALPRCIFLKYTLTDPDVLSEKSRTSFFLFQLVVILGEVGNVRKLTNRPEIRLSGNGPASNQHAAKSNAHTSQGTSKETLEKPAPSRNRSIPRNRTGIPVMSAAPNKHVSPNARISASTNSNKDKTDLSARRRNSSGAVISTTALKRFNTSNNLPSRSTRNMPTSSSSHNLKVSHANTGKGFSSNQEEFY